VTTATGRPDLPAAVERPLRARAAAAVAAWGAALLVASVLDRAAYEALSVTDDHSRRMLESADWYRVLRVMGSMWLWGPVAAVFMMVDRARIREGARMSGGWTRRGVMLLTCALLSGGAAELLKALVGRLRPENSGGWYAFMSLGERLEWNWSDLGMPSSHAAVAFGAAMALSFTHRAAAPLLFLGAAGCGLTRVVMEQHYLSDVVAGAAVAYAVSLAVWRVDARNNGGVGLGVPAAGARTEGRPRPARGSAAP